MGDICHYMASITVPLLNGTHTYPKNRSSVCSGQVVSREIQYMLRALIYRIYNTMEGDRACALYLHTKARTWDTECNVWPLHDNRAAYEPLIMW